MGTRTRIRWFVAAAACALTAVGVVKAEERFEVTGREPLAAIAGVEIVTVRDTLLNACYTLFVAQPARLPAAPHDESTSLHDLATERDRRLSALTDEFERGMAGGVPATLGSNPLKYSWEADKVQSEYERRVREREIARLESQLAAIAGEPHVAVAGPAPCGPPASPSR